MGGALEVGRVMVEDCRDLDEVVRMLGVFCNCLDGSLW